MFDIPALVANTWMVIQPALPIIVTKGAEEIGKHAVSGVWDAIKKKFDSEAHTQKVLIKLLEDPQNSDVQGAFRVALQDVLEEDPSFTEKLAKLLGAIKNDYLAQVIGDGTIAQGNGAVAIGQNGIYIGGKARNVKSKNKR